MSREESYLSTETKAEMKMYMQAFRKGLRGDDLPKFSARAKFERAEYMKLYRQHVRRYGKKGR